MFTVSVETHFWASHQLGLADGSKEPVHWHNWLVIADVSSDGLNSMGVVADFRRLRGWVDGIVGRFGDAGLENIGYFKRNGSSAEVMAKYIYEKLEAELPGGVRLKAVRVVEEPGCSAKFSKPR